MGTYHGRGPMQLSWNYNYAPAGVDLRPLVGDPSLDLLANPEKITSDPKLAFATAIYFWTRTWRRRLCLMSAWIAAAALVPTTGRDSARSGSGAALTAPRGPA